MVSCSPFTAMLCLLAKPLILSIYIAVSLCGCAETYLDGPPLGTGYARLAATARHSITIASAEPSKEQRIGHQWVLFVIPAGEIRVKNPAQLGIVALYRALATKNFNPIVVSGDTPSDDMQHSAATEISTRGEPAYLTISKLNVSCSVPDLFFVRWVRCSTEIQAHFANQKEVAVGSNYSSEFKAFGFKPQLEAVLAKSLDGAVDDLLKRARL